MNILLYVIAVGALITGVLIFNIGPGSLGETAARITGMLVAYSAVFWVVMAQVVNLLSRIRANAAVAARYYRPRLPKSRSN